MNMVWKVFMSTVGTESSVTVGTESSVKIKCGVNIAIKKENK
jgi:hypothetical protein